MNIIGTRENRFRWGVSILSSVIMLITGLAVYWLVIDRSPPVTVTHGEVVGYERQPTGNYIVFIKWHGERHRNCYGNSKRWLTDSIVIPLPDIPYPPDLQDAPAGPVEWEVAIDVPSYFVTTGHMKLSYRIRIDYVCNPLQEFMFPIQVSPPPVPFEISNDGKLRFGNEGN